jgi:hypothetical protein
VSTFRPPINGEISHIDVDLADPAPAGEPLPTTDVYVIDDRLSKMRGGAGFTRNQVMEELSAVFHQIGGRDRLALWADKNLEAYYKIYAKLLPSSTVNIQSSGQLIIAHAVERSPLDAPPTGQEPDDAG